MASQKQLREFRKEQAAKIADELYWTAHSLMGCHGYPWKWICGARGRGKSYGAMEVILEYIRKYGQENVKVYYFRLSDTSVKAMLANKGRKAIDAKLVRKYKLDLTTHGDTLYNRGKPMIDFYALVSGAKKGKGIADYDPDFLNNRPKGVRRFIFLVLDEFQMQDNLEKRPIGDPVEQFRLYVENILRDQQYVDYDAVHCFCCANSVSECSGFLTQICGFVPETFGRFYLTRKHMIVENIPNSEAYIDKRKSSIAAPLFDYENDSNYTNVIKRDLATLKPKNQRLCKLTGIIKFGKEERDWFAVWDGNIIKQYNGQTFRPSQVIAMRRYLDTLYDDSLVKSIFERYDARAFRYNDLISQARFSAALKAIKK